MNIEMCHECNEETGNGGVWDGSLIYEGNPYCENCYVPTIIKICEDSLYAITRLQGENEKLQSLHDAIVVVNQSLVERVKLAEEAAEKLVTDYEETWSDNTRLREQLKGWNKLGGQIMAARNHEYPIDSTSRLNVFQQMAVIQLATLQDKGSDV